MEEVELGEINLRYAKLYGVGEAWCAHGQAASCGLRDLSQALKEAGKI